MIVFKICGSSKSNNLSFYQNHLIKNPILFCKYLSPKKIAQKWACICLWISVFRRKKLFENPIFGCRDFKQNPSLIFLGHPVNITLTLLIILGQPNKYYQTKKCCSAWSGLKLNTKIGLNHHHHHPPSPPPTPTHHKTFRTVLGIVGG